MLDAKLRELHAWIAARARARRCAGSAYVDTGPLLERDLARRAGLGWFGKNTNLINPTLGSFFFLGALLVDLELAPDEPFETDRCGTCTRCIDACPDGRDRRAARARRDEVHLVPHDRAEGRDSRSSCDEPIGELLYGCDICQDVCPWNEKFSRALPAGSPFAAREAIAGKDARTLARELLAMTQEEFSAAFRGRR